MARRDTRELILKTSLWLFNRDGEPNVPINLIADEAEISPGNLHYHFRKKEEIVQALCERFAHEVIPLTEIDEETDLSAEAIWFRLHVLYEFKAAYRFLYRNLADIATRMPRIEKALHGVMRREQRAVKKLLSLLIMRGALDVSDIERAMLMDQIMLTLTFWVQFADLFDPQGVDEGDVPLRAIARVFLLTQPYLTEPCRSQVESMAQVYLSIIGG